MAPMQSPQRRADDNKSRNCFEICGQGGSSSPSSRVLVLCLALLNAILLIVAVVIGINCAKVKAGSFHVSHPVAAQLISELSSLRGNYSDVMEAEVAAKNAFVAALETHAEIKVKIVELKAINDNYQRQGETLQKEKMTLKANISAVEHACGCPSNWIYYNTSCYLFSYVESKTIRKNWLNSREDCISRGADLVVVDSPGEQKFISHTIEDMKSGSDIWQNAFWIGLTDRVSEGHWVWVNNVTEVEQRYWKDGEPNNLGRLGEDCAMTIYSRHNPWKTRNDGHCNVHVIHWICEINYLDSGVMQKTQA